MKRNLILLMLLMNFAATAKTKSSDLHDKLVTITRYGSIVYVIGEEKTYAKLVKKKSDTDLFSAIRIVPGLADKKLISFESVKKPGHFLRHQGSQLKWHKANAAGPFKKDATFSIVKGLAGLSSVSFASLNYPSRYITYNRKKELWIKEKPDKRSATFKISILNN